jgi:hypothetical protein
MNVGLYTSYIARASSIAGSIRGISTATSMKVDTHLLLSLKNKYKMTRKYTVVDKTEVIPAIRREEYRLLKTKGSSNKNLMFFKVQASGKMESSHFKANAPITGMNDTRNMYVTTSTNVK